MSSGGRSHRAALEAIGCPGEAVLPLTRYLDLLAAWGPRVNLTGRLETPEQRVDVLVRDPLAASEVVGPGLLLDIGSGNGTPGLVLAVLLGLPAVLLEPRQKRWAFLREAARVTGRPALEVLRLRHDAYRPARLARTLTIRALALPLRELEPLVEPGGQVLVFGGQPRPSPGLVGAGERPLPHAKLNRFTRVEARA